MKTSAEEKTKKLWNTILSSIRKVRQELAADGYSLQVSFKIKPLRPKKILGR